MEESARRKIAPRGQKRDGQTCCLPLGWPHPPASKRFKKDDQEEGEEECKYSVYDQYLASGSSDGKSAENL